MKRVSMLGLFFLVFLFPTSVFAASRGMTFDGIDDSYSVDLGSDWVSSSPWTIESTFTLRSWNTKTFDHIFSLGDNHNITMYVHSSAKRLSFKGTFGGVIKDIPISSLSLNREYHVAAVFNGNSVSVFLNNVLMQTILVNDPPGQKNAILSIGGTEFISNAFKGEISEFALWNKSLTQNEIFNIPKTGMEPNLVVWYQFNPLATGKAYDLTPHHHDISGKNFNSLQWQLRPTLIQPNALTWKWNENSYATSYMLTRSGSNVYTGSGTSARDNGLTPGTTYTYSLKAISPTGESNTFTQTQNSGPASFLSFNGNNQYLKVNKNLFQFPMTIEMWVKSNDPAAPVQFLHAGAQPGDGWGSEDECNVGQNQGDYGFFCKTNGSTNTFQTFGTPIDTSWHHLAIVFNNPLSFYMDGVLVKTANMNSIIPDFSAYLPVTYIGRPSKNTRFTNGLMSELRIWNTARSATDIASMWDKSATGNEPGLVAYYPLDGLFSGQALDRTPSNNHAQAFGFLFNNQKVNLSLIGGGFGFSSPSLSSSFSTVTLNGNRQTTTASLQNMTMVDARGTGGGWRWNISATRFTEIGGSGLQLASSSLVLSPPTLITPIGGTDSRTPSTNFPGDVVIDNGVSSTYLQAQTGEGMGTFSIEFPSAALTLTLMPGTTKVDPLYYPSTTTPYESTISWTLVTGP